MKKQGKWALFAFGLGILTQLLTGLLTRGWMLLWHLPDETALTLPQTAAEALLYLLLLLGIAPVAEEGLFRGLMADFLQKHMPEGLAWGIVTLLFIALHGSLENIPAYGVVSLLALWLKKRSGKLWPCMVFHGGYNACALLLVLVI